MTALKLAYRNLAGAGLRTWLNVFVLSLAYVIIIWHKGILDGWNAQARQDMIDWEIAAGMYWHNEYDPYDPFTLADAHAPIPEIPALADAGTPVLVAQATVYPHGRIQGALLKGIDPDQQILKLPSEKLAEQTENGGIPAIIGTRMAGNTQLKAGDRLTARWRDADGTFDAAELVIKDIFKTTVQSVDIGQIWIPLGRLQDMLGLPGEATLLVMGETVSGLTDLPGWKLKTRADLLEQFEVIMRQKSIGGSFLYIILLSLAMLAVFDTQILSIWRRQREIGTHIALGMTRAQVIGLFTLEGAMHAVLAAFMAALWGIPFLSIQAVRGFRMPEAADDYGLALAESIFPRYSFGLVVSTIIIVLIASTIVSYLPARRIAGMKPTDAIKGKIQ